MRVVPAAYLVRSGELDPNVIRQIGTDAEQVSVFLIAGCPEQIPPPIDRPERAWAQLNQQQKNLVTRYAPVEILRKLVRLKLATVLEIQRPGLGSRPKGRDQPMATAQVAAPAPARAHHEPAAPHPDRP